MKQTPTGNQIMQYNWASIMPEKQKCTGIPPGFKNKYMKPGTPKEHCSYYCVLCTLDHNFRGK